MPRLSGMPKRDVPLPSLRRCKTASDGAATTIPAAVEAWVGKEPLAVVLKALNGGPPRSVNRGVIARVASATRGPARIVNAAGAIDLIDRRLVGYVKAGARSVCGEAGNRGDPTALIIDGDRCGVVPSRVVAHEATDAIV